MQVDIVKRDGDFAVYPRAAFKYGEYEGDPLFTAKDEGDCWDWCEKHGHQHRQRRLASLVPEKFVHDLEQKCDKWFAKMAEHAKDCGRRIESDITYRASAAWKENPTHYCYNGDFGGSAKLVKTGEADANAGALMLAQQLLDSLYGASSAVWELGFVLTFDKDGKHKVFGHHPQWVTLDEED